MKNFILSAIVALGAIFTASAVNNVAYQDATVRFTVITDGAVRMEYAPDGKFVDDKSFVAVERDYAPVKYTVKDGSWVEITTPKMKLRYKKGSGAFTEKNTENRRFYVFQFNDFLSISVNPRRIHRPVSHNILPQRCCHSRRSRHRAVPPSTPW